MLSFPIQDNSSRGPPWLLLAESFARTQSVHLEACSARMGLRPAPVRPFLPQVSGFLSHVLPDQPPSPRQAMTMVDVDRRLGGTQYWARLGHRSPYKSGEKSHLFVGWPDRLLLPMPFIYS